MSDDNKSAAPAGAEPVAPMTGTLMARLFVVPAIIVCVMLGVAVVVVLFGSSSIDRQDSVANLLARLESDSGERTMGAMLMPKAKESWQAAQELAQRLAQKEKFLKPDEIEPTAGRIIALLDRFPAGQDVEEAGPAQQYFLMMALARLGTDSAVEPLVKRLKDPNGWTRKTALQSLAEMRGTDKARRSVPAILPLLDDRNPAVQIVACAAIAALAEPGNAAAIRALSAKLESDREVQWNAAMTLARLGDASGKMVLMNMLDRGYWEKLELEYAEGGSVVRRKYTDVEVANNLKSAIEAASSLHDAELTGLVARLEKDKAVAVRDAAREASAKMAIRKAEMRGAASTAWGPPQADATLGRVS